LRDSGFALAQCGLCRLMRGILLRRRLVRRDNQDIGIVNSSSDLRSIGRGSLDSIQMLAA